MSKKPKSGKTNNVNVKSHGGYQSCTHKGLKQVLVFGASKDKPEGKGSLWCGGAKDVMEADASVHMRVSVGGTSMLQDSIPTVYVESPVVVGATSEEVGKQFGSLLECDQRIRKDVEEARKKAVKDRAALVIAWPDMGVPGLPREWWDAFVADLLKLEGNTAMFCHGGHGRTGTALAIIVALCKVVDVSKGECPIEWVRKHYCNKCVETDGQIRYVEDVLDYDSKVKASMGGIGGAWTNGAGGYGGIYGYDDEEYGPKAKSGGKEGGGKGSCVKCAKPCNENEWDDVEGGYLCTPCWQKRAGVKDTWSG
jgi:hypothetical protein